MILDCKAIPGREQADEMNGVQGHDSALQGYTGPRTAWANEINFVMSHAPGAGSIAQPVDLQSSVLPLYHGCTQWR